MSNAVTVQLKGFDYGHDGPVLLMIAFRTQQKDILSRKSNLPAGLVGEFLGSLIGCILWIIIYNLGYIADIAGAVTGICSGFFWHDQKCAESKYGKLYFEKYVISILLQSEVWAENSIYNTF